MRLSRLAGYTERPLPVSTGSTSEAAAAAIDSAAKQLRQAGYRVEQYEVRGEPSVSAERGYLRETGNLVFHTALVGGSWPWASAAASASRASA